MRRAAIVSLVATAFLGGGCASAPPPMADITAPIPLDTTDPRYATFFSQIRSQITSKWIYPYEASSKGIEGELVIDFSIAKSGEVQSIELRKSSGVAILDEYAMRAVRLASPFPPVPDAISKGGLPIHGIFRYHRNGTVEPRGPKGK